MGLLPSELAYVPFISVDNMMKLVNANGVSKMISLIADEIEACFMRWEEFDKTPRIPAHSDVGVIELMPTADDELYGFKYVNGHPSNTKAGLQTVTAFGVLSRMDTGYPILLTEMTILTALRTAATSALVAKYLAPKNAKTMAMIGNGAQCEFQALGFKELVGIKEVRLYDIDQEATIKAQKNLEASGLTVIACRTPEEAVSGAEIITTCTADKRNATILSDNMVAKEGIHINAIGGDCPGKTELQKDILLRGKIFVEYPPQTRIEGELQQLPSEHKVHELWQVMRGEVTGRAHERELTIFDSVGFAVEDFAALKSVAKMIEGTDFYTNLDMLADPDDPRDLFGMIGRAQ